MKLRGSLDSGWKNELVNMEVTGDLGRGEDCDNMKGSEVLEKIVQIILPKG